MRQSKPGAGDRLNPIHYMKKASSKKSIQQIHILVAGALLATAMAGSSACAQDMPTGDAAHGRAYFQISCAVCHSRNWDRTIR